MSATVYLVEDDASVRKGLDRLLRSAGYRVESLDSASAYLARATVARPACLVLDIRMPGMSGFELQRAIAGTVLARPIVFITGHGDEDIRMRALSTGAVDVLFKPIDEAVLIEAVERALHSAVLSN